MIGFFKYIKGYLRIKVWGFSPERFMNLCSNRDILLWNIERDGEIYFMNISIKGFYKLRPIVRKTGTRVAILERYGLPFFLPVLGKRKIFIAGMLFSVSFWLLSSLFIWDIELSGNCLITSDVFQSFLKEQQVVLGMRKEKLDIEELEKEIRRAFPQITWTSARLQGTKLKIDIKENDAPIITEAFQKEDGGMDLAAEYDGTIVSMIVRRGVPKVSIGDTVEKGTILVDGKVPVYREDGTIREYQYVQADADLIVEHTRTFQANLPFDYIKKEYSGRNRKRYFLRTGEKEWKLPMETPFLVYDSVMKESRPLIFEKLSIPISFGCYTYREYQNVEYQYTLPEAKEILNQKVMGFLESLEEKGVQIIEKNVKIETNTGMWTAKGEFLVREPFGQPVDTAIPESGEMEAQ